MNLDKITKELENAAALNNVEILVDSTTKPHNFIPIINERGIVGAVGEYLEEKEVKIGYFILNSKIVKYALEEGFDREQLFYCFKDKIFDEVDKDKFFRIMTEKTF
jgi:hypothetical protein